VHGQPPQRAAAAQHPAGPASPAFGLDLGPAEAAAVYRTWDWPVTLHQDQVWLALGSTAVALMIPAVLANRVAAVLTARRCPPAILTHPYAPEHRIVLAGEPYPVALHWPTGVCRVATNLLLPPTPPRWRSAGRWMSSPPSAPP
jgi:hypothetical protein